MGVSRYLTRSSRAVLGPSPSEQVLDSPWTCRFASTHLNAPESRPNVSELCAPLRPFSAIDPEPSTPGMDI